MSVTAEKDKMRVMLWRMLAGAVVGAAGTGLFLAFVGEPHMDLKDPGVMIAIVSGLTYVLIGLIVALGLASPKAGAKFLNVEDAEEIREEGPKLWLSALCCLLIGGFLLALAMAGGLIGTQLALIVAGACLAGVLFVGTISARKYDELTRQISLEASAWSFYVILLGGGLWAALAHLGYGPWISPIAFVAALPLLLLVVCFVVIARKGMLIR
ncbi:hypothetical protein LZ016_06290 [Sphingomonas sp. SM33]|uniref:DUF2178 domain-containing protein n=1 Tax=Sphingomonas telluris TaxID=2907998 RepID=A0ABS9VLT8_9SPHN|nr:hypothetical protein [Sphingomonas telluris]MCH8615708.1 hypothetical protein [Sphingomonas telluris]